MKKQDILRKIEETKIIGIIRLDSSASIIPIVKSLLEAGIDTLEITANTPGCFQSIETLRKQIPQLVLGVGTVTTVELTQKAIDSGAQFIVTPIMKEAIIQQAIKQDITTVIGAFSPTEVHAAHQHGADLIKLFPANYVDPGYMKAVKATLKEAKFVPTGGINSKNAKVWLEAGAAALGCGSSLFTKELIKNKDYKGIQKRATNFKQLIDEVTT